MLVENILLELTNVVECAVLTRPSAQGEQRVAYIVPSGQFSPGEANAAIRQVAPEARVPDRYVLVTRLPFDADGKLDEATLLGVPCIDDALAARAEQQLKARPEVQSVALFVEHTARPTPLLHVSSLLDSVGSSPAAESQAPRAPRPGGAGDATLSTAASAERPPALVRGDVLRASHDGPTTLPELLQRAAERFDGPRITYVTEDGSTRAQSFAELLTAARRVGAGLQAHGLLPGQAVVLQLTAPEHTLLGFWGCVLGGFVPVMSAVPSSYELPTSDLERLKHVSALFENPPVLTSMRLQPSVTTWLTGSGVEQPVVLAVEPLRDSRAAYREPELNPDATAFYSLTSGSTGAPKAILLSHRNILSRASGTNQLCGYSEQDRILNWLPFDHIGSISDWHLRCVLIGCAMFYSSKEYVLGEPLNWLRLMERFRITRSWAPNFAYALLSDALNGAHENWDLSCIAGLLTAGEAVSSGTVHAFLERLAPHGLSRRALQPAFGMAELGSGVTYYLPTEAEPIRVEHVHRAHLDGALVPVPATHPDAVGFTSLGPVVPGASMRIVDDGERVLPELCVGRLQIAGAPVCLGYYADPEANRRVFVGDGWFDTGDRGFISGGELYLTGRDKETLIVSGANYGSAEVEACAEAVEGVRISFTAACAVRPRGASGERLAVFFSPTRTSERELIEILRGVQNGIAKKTGVKPDYLIPLEPESIPKTAIGKLQRKALARRFEAGEFDARVRETDLLLENENTVPDWFLRPIWRARDLAAGAVRRRAARYWLVGDGSGLCDELARQLEAHGATVVRTPNAERRPEVSSRFTHVVDLRDYGAPEHDTTPATSAAERRALELAELGERLTAAAGDSTEGAEPIRLFVVASHSQCVTDDADVIPARAMVPALTKALSQEHVAIAARHLDVPFVQDDGHRTDLAKLVAAELAAPDKDDEVAYRAGQRFTPAFERVPWTAATRHRGLEREQLYVIIGGIGGIGVELCKYLLEKWRAKLLVVGRSPLPDAKDDASHGALARWRELEARGDVTYAALDVSDTAALRRAVRERETALGLSVAGFFHLAGVYHEGPLLGSSPRELATSFAPKLAGTEAVHDLARERPSAFVACFSSLASVWSGSGIGAYAAANRLSDTVARRERQRGVRSYSLNWSVWKGLGIGANSAPEPVLRGKGFHPIPTLKGLWSLEAILAREPEQFLIGIDCDSSPVLRRLQGEAEPIARLRGVLSLHAGAEPALRAPSAPDLGVADAFGNPVHVELVELDPSCANDSGELDRDAIQRQLRGPERVHAPPENPTQAELLEIWKRLLNVSEVGIDDSFFDLGGTSLLSVRLFSEVQRRFGASLSPGVLLHTSSVRGLSALIEGESAAPALDSLSAMNGAAGSPALFLLHDAEGQVEMYQELADQLAPQLAVYGLRPHQRPAHPALHTRIADMVAHYVSRIRECQPTGPYCVGGWSTAGPLAVEVANALSAQGQRVALVALLDAASDGRVRLLRSSNALTAQAAERRPAAAHEAGLSEQLKDAIRQQARHLGQRGLDYARVALLQRFVDHGHEIPWFLQHIPAKTVLEFALRKHRPARFAGRLTLFRASSHSEVPARAPSRQHDYGWSSRASSVRVVEVAGDHRGMLTAPHVARLAKELRRHVQHALADGAATRADKEPPSATAW